MEVLPLSNYVRVKILDLVRGTNQLSIYKKYLENQYSIDKEEIIAYQAKRFDEVFKYHYENNYTYRHYVDKLGYKHKNFVFPQDVPFISKEYFKNNSSSSCIKENIHITKYSGGSTGVPLTVHLSKDSIENFWPSIWRAFDVYDILPCDKVMMIAGPSLFNNRSLSRKVYDYVNQFQVTSAFDLSDDILERAYRIMVKDDIKAVYGYTSAVLSFLSFLQKRDYKLHLKCIFTTSETFIPAVRSLALEYCNCDIIDTYGANDGGIQSFECEKHAGYHINFERCFVEIIDNEIVLTDLLNLASPFIRYKVGDYTSSESIITERCECGRSLFRIQNISGRINQFIIDSDNTKIHTEFFSHLFSNDNSINQYQITQTSQDIIINIQTSSFNDLDLISHKYTPLIKQRFKIPFTIVFNKPIQKLSNMKTPILININ